MAREGEGGGRGRDRDNKGEKADSEFVDRLVHINRVAKVVKGGRRFGFAALVVVGDQRGRVGFGHGKAREVPEAIRKATEAAKRAMIKVPLKDGRTLHHETRGHHGAGKVIVRPAWAMWLQSRWAPQIPTTWCAQLSTRCSCSNLLAWSHSDAGVV